MKHTLVLAALLLCVGATRADEAARATPLLPAYVQECSACHLPYAPRLLPAASWQRLMDGLPKHFGTDASLDAATRGPIERWLLVNADARAGTGKRARSAPPDDRITRADWFVHEHGGPQAALWKRSGVKSASDCAACHTQAQQGTFNERDIRLPR